MTDNQNQSHTLHLWEILYYKSLHKYLFNLIYMTKARETCKANILFFTLEIKASEVKNINLYSLITIKI